MNEFELNGRKFKIGKLNAFKQFHIVRRIAPILADLLPAIGALQKIQKDKSNKSESEKFEETATMLAPLLTGLSKLSDQDADYVLYGLLSCVEQNYSGAWSYVSRDQMLMAQDLDLPVLFQIAGRAFMFNLSSFFAVLPAVSPGAR